MNKNLTFYRKLPIPMEVKAEFPVSEELAKKRLEQIAAMADIFESLFR